MDLLVGIRAIPHYYGVPAGVYLLENDGKFFTDVTGELAPELTGIGMITDVAWADLNGDGISDIVVAGEYMPVSLFMFENGRYIDRTDIGGLSGTHGWWKVLECTDIDLDGDIDIIGGITG
jgi:enediyne biosynthesis protein E4